MKKGNNNNAPCSLAGRRRAGFLTKIGRSVREKERKEPPLPQRRMSGKDGEREREREREREESSRSGRQGGMNIFARGVILVAAPPRSLLNGRCDDAGE